MGTPMNSYLSKERTSGASELKPLTVTVRVAKKLTGLGHTTVYALIKDGTLRTTRVRGRRLIHFSSIEKLVGKDEAA
jgi:excisionase family DNA binding protein